MKKGALTKRDFLILGVLVLAVAGVTAYRMWEKGNRAEQPLDFGGLPAVAAFSSSGCPACAEQKRVFDQLAPQYEGRAKLVLLDVYDYIDLARQHNVEFVPTLLFIDRDGRVVDTRVGVTPADDLKAWLQSVGVTP